MRKRKKFYFTNICNFVKQKNPLQSNAPQLHSTPKKVILLRDPHNNGDVSNIYEKLSQWACKAIVEHLKSTSLDGLGWERRGSRIRQHFDCRFIHLQYVQDMASCNLRYYTVQIDLNKSPRYFQIQTLHVTPVGLQRQYKLICAVSSRTCFYINILPQIPVITEQI